MFALTSPPPHLPLSTLVKLAVKARDRRFELTFTSPCNRGGLLAVCWACLRTVTAVCLQVNVVLVVDIFFSRSASGLSRVT